MFNRKETVVEPEATGTSVLRKTLKVRLSRPGASAANIARDINEALADAANRSAARAIADRMAGDAGDAVARGIARQLMPSLSGAAKPAASVTDHQLLEDFANGKADLSAEIKNKLAALLYQTGSYNAKTDRLKSVGPEATSLGSLHTQPYVPNPNAYPPQLDRTQTKRTFMPGPADGPGFKKRAGWE